MNFLQQMLRNALAKGIIGVGKANFTHGSGMLVAEWSKLFARYWWGLACRRLSLDCSRYRVGGYIAQPFFQIHSATLVRHLVLLYRNGPHKNSRRGTQFFNQMERGGITNQLQKLIWRERAFELAILLGRYIFLVAMSTTGPRNTRGLPLAYLFGGNCLFFVIPLGLTECHLPFSPLMRNSPST